MKIKTIEYQNFRNFKERGKITCSTDGKITIIYGKNGDGKTTLHQLFYWIIYGEVNFNKTTTEHLYNLSYESEQEYGNVFEVMGRLDFEHNHEEYSLTRTATYKKEIENSKKIKEELSLQKMDEDLNWKKVSNPEDVIEKLLPSGLSEYFFFDGESMIADLRVKGKESAQRLRKALYSMFDLDVVERALDHIGKIDLKTTVLGKLYLSKGKIASGSEINAVKTNIENAQNKINEFKCNIQESNDDKYKKIELISKISETIGNAKSKEEYEKKRCKLIENRDLFLKNSENAQAQFGSTIIEMFPQLLISKAVLDAKDKLNLKVNSINVPEGLNRRLVKYLLNTDTCICGNKLSHKEKDKIEKYLKLLPPNSYSIVYHDFAKKASDIRNLYDKDKVEDILKTVIENQEKASDCDKEIRELDEEEKNSKDIENLIIDRQEAESSIIELDSSISEYEKEKEKFEIYLKQQMKKYDELTSGNEASEKIEQKINVMTDVKDYFMKKLEDASSTYSENLQSNIQILLNSMLTSRRRVSVSNDFAIRVTDSFNDESKSEGQFAVVSFAYIGGILKMLKDEESLKDKEYPLVLDGPFSKLDKDQRQNVVNALPKFAPQVIVFSKDDLHDVIPKKNIGNVWTINSNVEKNIAVVEEGKKWK